MARRQRTGAQRERGEPEGPLRQCALTRAERPLHELIRFVATPEGSIVADLSRRLPGRGVWITADIASVAAAGKANVFAKSFKRQVKVPPGLAEAVVTQLLRRTLEALSLANKAGLVTAGFAQVEALLASGGAVALVHGSDAAPGGREKLDRKFLASQRERGADAPIVDSLTIEQISLAMGRSNVVHAALIQGGAAMRFLSEAGRWARYRSGFSAL